jgi:tetrahydromethanopterin S-methyltransferase subunit E
MVDVGPPIGLMAIGLILWLAVTATIAGISIQTVGLILFVVGLVWLVIEVITSRRGVVDAGPAYREPVYRERVVQPPVREREREIL